MSKITFLFFNEFSIGYSFIACDLQEIAAGS